MLVDVNGVVKLADFGMAKHVSSTLRLGLYFPASTTVAHKYSVAMLLLIFLN